MDGQARGEAADPIVLHDEEGRAFAFRPLRALRDGADPCFLAELQADIEQASRAGDAR